MSTVDELQGPTVENSVRQPSRDQLDRIRELSTIVLGDPDALFKAAGHPHSAWEASAMLGALHKTRHRMKPLPGRERELTKTIQQIKDRQATGTSEAVEEEPHPSPEEDQEKPMTETATKTCSQCGETKALTQFNRNKRARDGHRAECRDCTQASQKAKRDPHSEANRARVKASVKDKSSYPQPEEDPPPSGAGTIKPSEVIATMVDGHRHWSEAFTNPTLNQLRTLQAFLTEALLIDNDLETVAGICEEITATFATKATT